MNLLTSLFDSFGTIHNLTSGRSQSCHGESCLQGLFRRIHWFESGRFFRSIGRYHDSGHFPDIDTVQILRKEGHEMSEMFRKVLIRVIVILAILIMFFPVYMTFVGASHSMSALFKKPVPLLPGPYFFQNMKIALLSGAKSAGRVFRLRTDDAEKHSYHYSRYYIRENRYQFSGRVCSFLFQLQRERAVFLDGDYYADASVGSPDYSHL